MTKHNYKRIEQRSGLEPLMGSVECPITSGVALFVSLFKTFHNEKTTNSQRCQVR